MNETRRDWFGRHVFSYYSGNPVPPSFQAIIVAHLCVCATVLTCNLILLFILAKAYQKPRSESLRGVIKLIVGLCVSGSIHYILNLIQAIELDSCLGLAPAMAAVFVVAHFFSFLLLGKRAASAINARDRKMKRAAWVLQLMAYAMLPFSVVCVVAMSDVMYFDKYCLLYADSRLSALFLICNTIMCSGYLGLFFYPIWKHLKVMKSSVSVETSNRSMQRSAKRNFILSLITIVSTFASMSFMSILGFEGKLYTDERIAYLGVFQFTFAAIDLAINTCAILAMTSAWVPQNWSVSMRRSVSAPSNL